MCINACIGASMGVYLHGSVFAFCRAMATQMPSPHRACLAPGAILFYSIFVLLRRGGNKHGQQLQAPQTRLRKCQFKKCKAK